jgi:hypothetical protein
MELSEMVESIGDYSSLSTPLEWIVGQNLYEMQSTARLTIEEIDEHPMGVSFPYRDIKC